MERQPNTQSYAIHHRGNQPESSRRHYGRNRRRACISGRLRATTSKSRLWCTRGGGVPSMSKPVVVVVQRVVAMTEVAMTEVAMTEVEMTEAAPLEAATPQTASA